MYLPSYICIYLYLCMCTITHSQLPILSLFYLKFYASVKYKVPYDTEESTYLAAVSLSICPPTPSILTFNKIVLTAYSIYWKFGSLIYFKPTSDICWYKIKFLHTIRYHNIVASSIGSRKKLADFETRLLFIACMTFDKLFKLICVSFFIYKTET